MFSSSKLWGIVGVFVFLITFYIGIDNGFRFAYEKIDVRWSQYDLTMYERCKVANDYSVYVSSGECMHIKELCGKVMTADTHMKKDMANTELNNYINTCLEKTNVDPDLKRNEDYRTLVDEVNKQEKIVAMARQEYIDALQDYNLKITFPCINVWYAEHHGLVPRDF